MAAFYQAPKITTGSYTTKQAQRVYRSFSSSSGVFTSGGFAISTSAKDLLLDGNEKATMQDLNERLAAYLDKVRSLEKTNSKLELQIKECYEKRAPAAGRDYGAYYQVIDELRAQFQQAQFDNARIVLEMDNIKLAAEDFRIKYINEQTQRQSVEKDIQGLRHIRDELTVTKANLEVELEGLQEEKIYLKKNQEEEVAVLSKKVVNRVNVELDAAPGRDIGKLLADMRLQYEELVKKKQQEVKEWFDKQTEELNMQMTVCTAELTTSKPEITRLTQTIRDLEIKLQTEISKKRAFQKTVAQVEAEYGMQLEEIQEKIRVLEAQLLYIRTEMQRQSERHTVLAQEIDTYRHLLEGDEFQFQAMELEEPWMEQNKSRKIKTIVEEIVDGKVMSSEIKEVVEKI